jgi:hypothetical protein
VLVGCSSSSGSSQAGAGSSGSTKPSAQQTGGENGVPATSSAAPNRLPAAGAKGASATPGTGVTGAPLANPDPAVIYSFTAAGAAQTRRFGRATTSVKGVYEDLDVFTASRSGADRADVAVYTFSGAQAANPRFQGQIVSQLVTKASGAKQLRYQDIDGKLAVVGAAKNSAVGYFSERTAVVVLARPGTTAKRSLGAASAVAYAYSRR